MCRDDCFLTSSRTYLGDFISLDLGVNAAIMATSVDAKLLKSTKFPPEFNKKVDMQKVNVEVMKK